MGPDEQRGWSSVGEISQRAGVSVATLRYYERLGLIRSERTAGNQRRYPRHVLRRLAFVAAAQSVGLSLAQVGRLLGDLPHDRAPSQEDWTRLGGRGTTSWRPGSAS